jgi:hypothetical protein
VVLEHTASSELSLPLVEVGAVSFKITKEKILSETYLKEISI